MTAWKMGGTGEWIDMPIILIAGEVPFWADNPQPYIAKLEAMHGDLALERRQFWTLIGELKDGFEYNWYVQEVTVEESHNTNGNRDS
jgi:hypothetical protein